MFQVLVAEDEVWIRDALVEMIEKLSPLFSVIGDVDNGLDAWEFIRQNWPSIVVTDIMMPNKNGLWLSEQIHENRLPVIVIVISGYDNFQYAKQAMRFGISEYLLKPIDESELQEALQRSIKRVEQLADVHESMVKIQDFIEQFPVFGQQKQLQEMQAIVAHALRLKSQKPGAGKSVLGVLSVKINEMLQGMNSDHQSVPLIDGDDKSIQKYFRGLMETWILLYPEYSKQNANMVIEKVCDYIQMRYYDDFSLAKLAEQAHLSVSYFSTLFKKVTGKTCLNYLNEVRLDRAKMLLQEPDLKIYEIANMVGYNSMPYFNRIFKQMIGITPAEYRKRLGL